MSNTEQKTVKSVTSKSNGNGLDGMTTEQRIALLAQLTASLSASGEFTALRDAEAQINAGRTAAQTARLAELDREIEPLRKQVDEINQKLGPLVAERNKIAGVTSKGSGERKERVTTDCPACGQGRHADNDKTKACPVYPGFKAATEAAKAAKEAIPTFGAYLAKHPYSGPSAVTQ